MIPHKKKGEDKKKDGHSPIGRQLLAKMRKEMGDGDIRPERKGESMGMMRGWVGEGRGGPKPEVG